ncbi:sensor histidine kinase [Belnapia rosea]|uniref:histidine kinase n=1 Tax=Belnapia rosea TaxID=938405 RepID=A0A1G7BYS0_9PROT|nr:HAMP domain-containing sensor histidine kinase [Belnapia rosea]SDB74828.1 Signal transduction histidine kinase [Belnapia rosea]SDE32189.1 Signal transduction histidine kinase [Belnapia rosea]
MMATSAPMASLAQIERELAYYRRECNDLGARLLRLQEEQSQAFREARRSRTVAKLIREAYRLADREVTPDEIGAALLEVIVENALCDGAALLRQEAEDECCFRVVHAIGTAAAPVIRLASPPAFFFTTSRTALEPPAYELISILGLPYVLWAYDRSTGHALILGNRSESNVSRPYEPGDQELIEGALSVYIDVLLRKQAETELRAAKATAERASEARSRFLATLTHELRTPLTAIIGFSEMMAPESRYNLAPAASQRYAGHIFDAGKHLLALIDGILDYSSLEQALPRLSPQWLPAEQVLNETASLVVGVARTRDVAVQVNRLDEPLAVFVDPLRFRQVLQNLLGNAVKFAPGGSTVEVAVARRPDGGACFTVQDHGIGMRAEDIPRALEPFQQIDGGHARAAGGIGLGLPIAKGLAEAHGGTLMLDSALGVGTTARVTLPPERVRDQACG